MNRRFICQSVPRVPLFVWLLWAGPRAARGKITVSGTPNGLNYVRF